MAIYEYRCLDCGARIEVMQRMGAAALTECGDECAKAPKRRTGRLERLFSTVNVGGRAAASGSGGRSEPAGADDPSCGRCGRVGPDVCSP